MAARPSVLMKNAAARLPSVTMFCPAEYGSSRALLAIERSSRSDSPWNNGTRFSAVTWSDFGMFFPPQSGRILDWRPEVMAMAKVVAAAVQASPVFLDRDATVDKARALITKAAG